MKHQKHLLSLIRVGDMQFIQPPDTVASSVASSVASFESVELPVG